MAHTRTFDKTDPADSGFAGKGAEEIRQMKEDVEERMQVDHYWDNDNDTSNADSDGHHKRATLEKKTVAPTAMADAGIVYVKDDTIAELHYKNEEADLKITEDGKIVRENLQRDCTGCTAGSSAIGFVDFATVNFDYESRWNAGDRSFDAGETGIYLITVDVDGVTVGQPLNTSDGSLWYYNGLKIYLNGEVYKAFPYKHQAVCLISLDAGDSVSVYTDVAISGAEFLAKRLV